MRGACLGQIAPLPCSSCIPRPPGNPAHHNPTINLQGLWALSAVAAMALWAAQLPGMGLELGPLSGPLSGLQALLAALPTIPHTHMDVVSGAAAASSFIGELLIVQVGPGLRLGRAWGLTDQG